MLMIRVYTTLFNLVEEHLRKEKTRHGKTQLWHDANSTELEQPVLGDGSRAGILHTSPISLYLLFII